MAHADRQRTRAPSITLPSTLWTGDRPCRPRATPRLDTASRHPRACRRRDLLLIAPGAGLAAGRSGAPEGCFHSAKRRNEGRLSPALKLWLSAAPLGSAASRC
eukprot:360328-Chlamydomonas_euryale.AAC.16